MEPWLLAMSWPNTLISMLSVDLSKVIWNILNPGFSLSLTPFIGIVNGFFNGYCNGYDIGYAVYVIGYGSWGAENYDCLISRVLL